MYIHVEDSFGCLMIITVLRDFYSLLITGRPIIAIDHGIKTLGFAVSDQLLNIAMPLENLNSRVEEQQILASLNLVDKYSACGIVVGLPMMMDGSISEQTVIVQKFVAQLSLRSTLPIYMQDERLTSRAANSLLKSLGLNRKNRTNHDDSIAASMILETVLTSIRTSGL